MNAFILSGLLTVLILVIFINLYMRERPLKIMIKDDEVRFMDLPMKISFAGNIYELISIAERLDRKLLLQIPVNGESVGHSIGVNRAHNRYIKISRRTNPEKLIIELKSIPAFNRIHIGSKKKASQKIFRYFRGR